METDTSNIAEKCKNVTIFLKVLWHMYRNLKCSYSLTSVISLLGIYPKNNLKIQKKALWTKTFITVIYKRKKGNKLTTQQQENDKYKMVHFKISN